MTNFIEREKIILSESLTKMLIGGWGKEVYDSVTVEKIIYNSDGLKVKGYLAYPNDKTKKYPCVIWNRGGHKKSGFIDEFNARGIFGQIASWGYVVFASMYRGSVKDEGEEEFGGADVNDILNLIPLSDELEFTENKKWAIEGWSRGGMMTFLTLKQKNIFSLAILTGAVTDLTGVSGGVNKNQKLFESHIKAVNEEKLKIRSAVHFVDKLPKETKYLIIHGANDDVVSPLQSIELAKRMDGKNFFYRLVILEEGDHFLKKHRKTVDQLRRDWYEKYLS